MLTIRPARPDEVAIVLDLWSAGQPVSSATDDEDAVSWLLRRDPEALLVAGSDGRVVGSLIVGWDGWRGWFYRLVVDPGMRRAGIATGLIEAGEARLRDLGARRILAMVMSEHSDAVGFWEAMGYERDERFDRFVRDLTVG